MKLATGSCRVLFLAAVLPFAARPPAQQGSPTRCAAPTPLDAEPTPPALGNTENKDVRRNRAFAMQPPTIPHQIDGYQIDLQRQSLHGLPLAHAHRGERRDPISVTHYMDRDGNMLGDVSPRRYFCTQCHVPQDEVKPLVENRFQDFDTVRANEQAKGGKAAAAKK